MDNRVLIWINVLLFIAVVVIFCYQATYNPDALFSVHHSYSEEVLTWKN